MAEILYESYYGIASLDQDYIQHYQVAGAKWHKRRYQNPDGSLTPEGRRHYGVGPPRETKAEQKYKTAKENYRKELARNNSLKGKKVDFSKIQKNTTALENAKKALDKAEARRDKLTTGEKLSRFSEDLKVGRTITREEKAEAKEAKAIAKAEKEKAKIQMKNDKEAAKKAKEAAKKALAAEKEQKILKEVIARADPDEVSKFAARLSTEQLAEIKSRINLKKDIDSLKTDFVRNQETRVSEQRKIDETKQKYADEEKKAQEAAAAARKEKIEKAVNFGKDAVKFVAGIDKETEELKAKARELYRQNAVKAAEAAGNKARELAEKVGLSPSETSKAVRKAIEDTATGGANQPSAMDAGKTFAKNVASKVINKATGRSSSDSSDSSSNKPKESVGERMAEKTADKIVGLGEKMKGAAGKVAEKAVERGERKAAEQEKSRESAKETVERITKEEEERRKKKKGS